MPEMEWLIVHANRLYAGAILGAIDVQRWMEMEVIGADLSYASV